MTINVNLDGFIGEMTQAEALEVFTRLGQELTLEQKIEWFKGLEQGEKEELAAWAVEAP